MKKFIITFIGLSILLISCEDQLDINRDPDAITPSQLALNVQLPASITAVAGVQGAYWAIIGGIWSQYWAQSLSSSQYRVVDNYTLGTTDGISTGGWNAAYDGLLDIRNVKANALEQENWNYYLIATVLESYMSQMLTDWYGDIPYAEANNSDILQPNFNTGEEVYDLMILDLDDALGRDLSDSQGSPPGSDDLIFEGDMSNWVKFANTLKLKIYLRQTEARPAVASTGITSMLSASFLDVDAALTGFTDAPNISNPLFESDKRQLNTTLNLRASTTMHSYLVVNGDDRISLFYSTGISLDQGDYNNTGSPTLVAVSALYPETPVYLISLEESMFMQAEAMERYNSGIGAKALYDAAVVENFNKWQALEAVVQVGGLSLEGSGFISTDDVYEYPNSGTFDEKLEAIITQKWIASYPGNGAEAFFEHNRTGFPRESSVTQQDEAYVSGQFAFSVNGVTGGIFPQRLLYPNTETARNINASAVLPITTPIWWSN